MQFTIEDACGSSLGRLLLTVFVFFGPPVWLGLMLWLRRSPRNARDVLLAVMRTPAGLLRRGADFIAWLVPAAALVGAHVFGMLCMVGMLRLLVQSGSLDADENLTWLVAPMLAAGALLLVWLRGPRTARDVLHVEHAPRRRR